MKKHYLTFLFILISIILVACVNKEREVFLVDFDTDGGRYIASQNVFDGDLVEIPEAPFKSNYIFGGWYKDLEFTDRWLFESYKITEDTTIYAKFDLEDIVDIVYYEVSFLLDESNIYLTKNVEEGNIIIKPTNPTKEGFEFKGWYLDGVEYDFNKEIYSNITLNAKWDGIQIIDPSIEYTISLVSNGGVLTETEIIVNDNETFVLPTPIHPNGDVFIGWFDSNNKLFDKNIISNDITLYAKYRNEDFSDTNYVFGTYPEAIFVEIDNYFDNIEVLYKLSNENTFNKLDSELIRYKDNKTLIDVVGLKTGFYDLDIKVDSKEMIKLNQVFVEAHDRSGYAHFNFSDGIGAYNDDGTLKSDAVVVYVTEENKNNIKIEGINKTGLGWILNNAQYSSSSSNTYSTIDNNNSLAKFNKPVVFRIIGKVTAPEGLTAYNSTNNGGSVGDNGNMARIKDANHITIEGIGQGAEIHGWGIHFMASTIGRGIGFEVRNITFDKYPEDAIGLEGIQSGGVLTIPVQRGWIHNSTFKQGYSENPAEDDKGFGDGSLDIKRGEYFTISYNQFLNARKTNLIGGADANLQYHLTYHHNLWQNSDSRTPLARNANIHLYNNVFETTDDNKGSISYAVNTRVNAYVFSEANYFNAIKNPFLITHSGGPIKSYGDVLYSTYGDHHQTTVSSRDELVTSNNKYENFDTNSNVFYYDSLNKKTNVTRLTDAVTAKKEVYAYSGTYKKTSVIKDEDHFVTKIKPTFISDTTTIQGGKITKGTPFYVFEINVEATFEMVAGNSTYKPVLVDIYGRRMMTGTGSVDLLPGVYVVESEQAHGSSGGTSQAKDSNVESLKIIIDTEAAKQQRIADFNSALSNIPTNLVYNNANKELINITQAKLDNLKPNEIVLVNTDKFNHLKQQFNNLGITHIESLINNIGEVNMDSNTKITSARNEYNNANIEIKDNISNYDILLNAEHEFKQFEIISINNDIEDLEEYQYLDILNLENVNELHDKYLEIVARYENLTSVDKSKVVNYQKVITNTNGINEILLAHEVKANINKIEVVKDELNLVKSTYDNYQSLSDTNKTIITNAGLIKLNEIYNEYQVIISTRREELYYFGVDNNYFKVEGGNSSDIDKFQYEEIEISKALKLESKTKITFTINSKSKIIMIFNQGDSIKINGSIVEIKDDKIELLVEAGEQIIERDGNPQARLIYMLIIENY